MEALGRARRAQAADHSHAHRGGRQLLRLRDVPASPGARTWSSALGRWRPSSSALASPIGRSSVCASLTPFPACWPAWAPPAAPRASRSHCATRATPRRCRRTRWNSSSRGSGAGRTRWMCTGSRDRCEGLRPLPQAVSALSVVADTSRGARGRRRCCSSARSHGRRSRAAW
jgi:hypothetical protein